MTINEFFEQQGAQTVLAKAIGSTRSNVSLWCSGKSKISIPSVIKLVTALNDLGVETTLTEVIMFFNERRLAREKEAAEG